MLRDLLALIEREPAASPLLQRLAAELTATGHTPSVEIGRLVRLADLLNTRQNQFFVPIRRAAPARHADRDGHRPLARAVRGARAALDRDRRRVRSAGRTGRLCGRASRRRLPDHRGRRDPCSRPTRLAHPLIPADRAVPNDVRLGATAPHLLLVSGSNMSGKSTWLRTIGINVVLAHAGAPVRARSMRLSPLQVGATLRIQDSLQAGQSRFFAEITRLSEIVAMARRHAADPLAPGRAVPARRDAGRHQFTRPPHRRRGDRHRPGRPRTPSA